MNDDIKVKIHKIQYLILFGWIWFNYVGWTQIENPQNILVYLTYIV